MKIREMELLVRVAETGSMTRAAQQLHLTPAAVSAAIQRIEDAVGIRLFERTTRSLHPTDEGVVLLEGCQDVVARWQRALTDARGHGTELEGTVHLSAPTDITYLVLESVVLELCREHPNLRVVLNTADAVRHLHREAIDIAVRYGPLQDSTLSARKLAEFPRVLVAAPSYVDERGLPESPSELERHRLLTLHLSNTPESVWRLRRDGVVQERPVESPLCGDGYLTRRWAVRGMGIAFKNLFDVIDDLEAGRLVRVLPDYTGGLIAVHALFPSRRFVPARVRALDTAISAGFAARGVRCQAWLDAR